METSFFSFLPSGRAELLWVSSGLLYSALHFLLLRWGVQSEGRGVRVSQSNHIFPARLYRRSKALIDLCIFLKRISGKQRLFFTDLHRLLRRLCNTLPVFSRDLLYGTFTLFFDLSRMLWMKNPPRHISCLIHEQNKFSTRLAKWPPL